MARVFLSYRRADSAAFTGRIYDHLVARFGRKSVFKDVDDIPAGVHFPDFIQSQLRQCAATLVMIGPQWIEQRDAAGMLRILNPKDHVRIEIETSLKLGLILIPILLDGATMPSSSSLPESLEPLSHIQGLVVRNDPDFGNDIRRVFVAVESAFATWSAANGHSKLLFWRRSKLLSTAANQTPIATTSVAAQRENSTLVQFEREGLASFSTDSVHYMQRVLEYASPLSNFFAGWGAVIMLQQDGEDTVPTVDATFLANYSDVESTFHIDFNPHPLPTNEVFQSAIVTHQPALLHDLSVVFSEAIGVPQTYSSAEQSLVRSLICVPLLMPNSVESTTSDKVIGFLVLASPQELQFSEGDKISLSEYAVKIVRGFKDIASLRARNDLLRVIRHDISSSLVPLEIELDDMTDLFQTTHDNIDLVTARSALRKLEKSAGIAFDLVHLMNFTLTSFFDLTTDDLRPENDNKVVDLNDVVKPAIAPINTLAYHYRNRKMLWNLPGIPILISGGMNRERMIRAILFSLVDSANKYALPDTPIIVAVSKKESEGFARVAVEHEGELVPHGARDTIWDLETSQLGWGDDNSRYAFPRWLSQARNISLRLGADMVYEARPPHTNTFSLLLPTTTT